MDKTREDVLPLSSLLLDPNNYRFQDDDDYVQADEGRFHEPAVQQRAFNRLRNEGLTELKSSITSNGFLTFERLVVRPYAAVDGLYVVVEGNRRVAALSWINQDHDAGVATDQSLLDLLEAIPVLVLDGDSGEDLALRLSLMGIRHVGGIREWGAYQRAKLVTELRDDFGLETGEVAGRLGMTAHEVNRRYRAFKALRQMEQDEEYADFAEPDMYPLFHEAITATNIKEWLGWDEPTGRFTNEEQLHEFYALITPTEHEENGGVVHPPKLPDREAVRQLRTILDVPEARRALFNPERSYLDALGIAKAEELSKSWVTQLGEAVSALNSVGALELKRLSDEDLGAIAQIRDVAIELLETHKKLTD